MRRYTCVNEESDIHADDFAGMDNVHFTEKGYQHLAKMVVQEITLALSKKGKDTGIK